MRSSSIGSAPMGGYALTGPQGVLQGSLRYTGFDQDLPDETPPGVLARFKFRVVDGRFGEPRSEEGAFPIEAHASHVDRRYNRERSGQLDEPSTDERASWIRGVWDRGSAARWSCNSRCRSVDSAAASL